MEIQIEDEETCRLIEELAELLGVTPEEAVLDAVRAKLQELRTARLS